MSAITLQGVEKWFGDVQVIKGIDLEVAPGEFVVFVGPSGCGKSTLLRMIGGLEETSRGQILIEEKDDGQADPLPVGDMPQEGADHPQRQAQGPRQEQASRGHERSGRAHGQSRTSVRLTKMPSISTSSGKCPLLLAKKADGMKSRASSQSIIAR